MALVEFWVIIEELDAIRPVSNYSLVLKPLVQNESESGESNFITKVMESGG
jgi:hypothetical protein